MVLAQLTGCPASAVFSHHTTTYIHNIAKGSGNVEDKPSTF